MHIQGTQIWHTKIKIVVYIDEKTYGLVNNTWSQLNRDNIVSVVYILLGNEQSEKTCKSILVIYFRFMVSEDIWATQQEQL